MSEPKPDSVITYSPSFWPIRSATSDELPCAMFANGPGVHQAGLALERLDQVRLQGVLQQHGHGARRTQVLRGHGLAAVERVRDGDRAEALAQVLQVARHGEDRHHLGRCGDVEAGLARVAVGAPALAERDRPQGAVVHVERALPVDPQGVDLVRVPVQDRGVEQRGEQVVGGPDRVDVAGEVEVQVLHRHHLGHAAAGGAALDAEDRAERRLAQAQERVLADVAEPLRQADGRGRLALARLRRRDTGDADDLPVRHVLHPVEHAERDLGLEAAVGLELVGRQARALGDRLDRQKLGLLRDLQAALHWRSSLVIISGSPPLRPAPTPACPRRSARARTARSARASCPSRRARRASCRRSAPP